MTEQTRRETGRATEFCVRDFDLLMTLLASKPHAVLSEFRAAQVGCLMELAAFRRLRAEKPDAAARIETVAASLGIPVDRS